MSFSDKMKINIFPMIKKWVVLSAASITKFFSFLSNLIDVFFKKIKTRVILIFASIVTVFAFLSNFFGALDDGLNVFDRLFQKKTTINIEGKWDEKVASQICLNSLREFGGSEKFGFECDEGEDEDCRMQDSIIGFFSMELEGKQALVGLTCSRPVFHDCHACGVSLSIFEFVKENDSWVLKNKSINAMKNGSMGEPDNIEVINIGYNKYGLVERGGYANMGEATGRYTLYAHIGDEFKIVFEIQSYFENYGALYGKIGEFWKTKVAFVKQGTGYYDLVATTEGLMENKKILKKDTYRFNGVEYVKSD